MKRSIRKLTPRDADKIRHHYERLGQEDRVLRFFGPTSEAFLERHASDLFAPRRYAVGFLPDGELRGLGELVLSRWPLAQTGEAALSVEPVFQGQGVGTALMERLLMIATNRGARRLRMSCLSHNAPMQRIARKFSGRLERDGYVMDTQIALSWPSYWSLAQEGAADWSAARDAIRSLTSAPAS